MMVMVVVMMVVCRLLLLFNEVARFLFTVLQQRGQPWNFPVNRFVSIVRER